VIQRLPEASVVEGVPSEGLLGDGALFFDGSDGVEAARQKEPTKHA
jgi:hypothetical protein